ncbi:MAG: hypothetical protein A3E32_00390 [Candidatus Zambryskibacteria bacterium RIFCSPHIGHO2_12_FULL_38_37]|uniref:Uncharacterized protein n=3 Tax=Candidatus Zambryskiibacteriota TaxID=1817925 RepID=A0A1G2T8C3_9BACT|nr:MAG: hypothetical protein A2W58_02730 [Candidatus Zambryskibacteria bacterium RIFCSPHIGHO2_02_38_10.5]OHA98246.1 MAG: hypothetical protein A3E32_00390 [Candidatus Zambryskibacteria bacterium RIFCSPHIGHO2_12_FULL_38_37]OHB11665.1 MAG: hypothetical protein A2Y49_01685 [Candidatus Zambryskibacteria bacterium RIFCSPLOWO2_12_39_8]
MAFISVVKIHPSDQTLETFFWDKTDEGWTSLPEHAMRFPSNEDGQRYIVERKISGGKYKKSDPQAVESVYKYGKNWF